MTERILYCLSFTVLLSLIKMAGDESDRFVNIQRTKIAMIFIFFKRIVKKRMFLKQIC